MYNEQKAIKREDRFIASDSFRWLKPEEFYCQCLQTDQKV